MTDLYETLGVERTATTENIRAAFRNKAKQAHPDAGGSPEEFHAISQAAAVLTAPRKRARYDATGDSTDKASNDHAAAMNIITSMVEQILGQINDDLIVDDLVEKMRIAAREREQNIRNDIEGMKRNTLRLSKFAMRFKRKSGDNALRAMIEYKISGITRAMEDAEIALRHAGMAVDILKDYSFEVDARPQMQTGTNAANALYGQMAQQSTGQTESWWR